MHGLTLSLPLCIGLLCLFLSTQHVTGSFPYYGTKIGALKRLHHGVSGDVYAVDSRTIFIKKFNYDGEAPAAYFYVGNTDKPSNEGATRLRDERGGNTALQRRYRNKDITLSLPDGKTLRDFKWFSVWCDEFAVNFGDVSVPANLDFPRPQKITGLRGVHDVNSDNIVIVDAQTLLVPNFSYDGEAPDAKFWVGRGQRPSPQGVRIPDENGTENPLRRYEKKTIVLTLPGDLTIFDIGHFGVWCEAFTVDFGHVRIPEGLNVPPSLKMLGISPQSKLNCEVLYDDLAFEVRWAVAGESIVVQLVAKLAENEYMSFGISPSKERSVMIGSDVVVAWVDRATGKGYAVDYYLDDKSQCSGSRGTCPDVNIEENTNSIRLLNAAMVNGYSIVTYQRSLQATDRLDLPISINGTDAIVWAIGPLNERHEASFHSQYTKHTHFIEFGRQPTWNCPMPESSASSSPNDEDDDDDNANEEEHGASIASTGSTSVGYPPSRAPEEEFYDNRPQALQQTNNRRQSSNKPVNSVQLAVPTPKPANTNGAWDIPAIQCYEPEDGVFYAQMGPTGGKHGYPAITGHVGWGISWYINGLLIPEIHVVRGKTYTFVVEGGNNPDIPAKYHPFYITDDPVGGYEHKREEEKKAIRIFAGVHRSRSGQVTPIGVGRLCNWTPDIDGPPADDYQSFGAYQRTLTLKCETGEPGVITWTPDANTPDTVYYHCYTHRYLGWKIHVHDTCDGAVRQHAAASERHEIRIAAPALHAEASNNKKTLTTVEELEDGGNSDGDGIAAAASIRHESKVSPNANFLLKHQTDLIKNHNMNGTPPKLSFEITKSTEITKLISDGIRAAEALEQSILRQQTTNSINNRYHHHSNINSISENSHSQQPQPVLKAKLKQNSSVRNAINGNDASQIVPQDLEQPHTKPHIHVYDLHSHNQTHAHNLNNYKKQHHAVPSLQLTHSPLYAPHYHHKLQHHHPNQKQKPHYKQHPLQNYNYNQQSTHSPSPSPSSSLSYSNSSNSNAGNNTNVPAQSLHMQTIGLSEYLRPPLNTPLFHPVKLPGRRAPPSPQKKFSPAATIVLPQQLPARSHQQQQQRLAAPLPQSSVIVKHYRRPVPTLLRPFLREPNFPIQPIAASVLLLGQPTELQLPQGGSANTKSEPVKVPYGDSMPQSSVQVDSRHQLKTPQHLLKKTPLSMSATTAGLELTRQHSPATASPVFKQPFDVHTVAEEPLPLQLATMQLAVNEGFKPDTVVVESGFRPIMTRRDGSVSGASSTKAPTEGAAAASEADGTVGHDVEVIGIGVGLRAQQQIASRREDPGSEIDEAMETDTLFLLGAMPNLKAQQTQNFEPMFIPSPPDSTNRTQNPAALQQPLSLQQHTQIASEPIAIKLRNSTRSEGDPVVKTATTTNDLDVPSVFDEVVSDDMQPITTVRTERDSSDGGGVGRRTDSWTHHLTSDNNEFDGLLFGDAWRRDDQHFAHEHRADLIDDVRVDDVNDDQEDEDDDIEDDIDYADDKVAQAAERIDTYYLPPDNRKIPDANLPSGAVITYDGKSVIDSSLVLPPKLDAPRGSDVRHLSKIEELVRNTPQFVPFRGEIPPAITEYLSTERSKSSPIPAATASANTTTASQTHTISTLSLSPPLPSSSASSLSRATYSSYTNAYNSSAYGTSSPLASAQHSKVTKLHITNSST